MGGIRVIGGLWGFCIFGIKKCKFVIDISVRLIYNTIKA